ncbi:deoxyribodipyrimidine photo-lyase [Alkalimarinus sediminis]|uniref:Deoxyribodipyrimidine photo-lyase n=1 Tax=Alkalimarinus sediminis TaxID=1632866 RepID=A0A9E8KKB7_9ALTE|nr:deoxyribodipyrimidine photo-lyase [Alkalimarinus sediminis]UZW75951.1 deoxyribodipyrimidine photo-lyase [Alkalimarinus sediminis]
MHNIVWFRSDLRVYDNPALSAAMQSGSVVAVYLLAQNQWHQHSLSPAKRALIVAQIKTLSAQLDKLNVPLKVIAADGFNDFPDILSEQALKLGASRIYCNIEYELNEKRCAQAVSTQLKTVNVELVEFHDSCMIQPGQVRTKQGECYKVYSAFKREFIEQYGRFARPILNRPTQQSATGLASDLTVLEEVAVEHKWLELWPAGEDEAHDRLNTFVEGHIKEYDKKRDIPSIEGTSQISPYLAIGALSTTQCMHAALSLTEGRFDSGRSGVLVWINELIWREFYRHLLDEYPRLSMHKPFKLDTDRLPWKYDQALFNAWAEGRTGYPIVDAAMRQLSQTGWMHNRLRMITAMFLTKHLFIDWRLGEKYFMEQLVDGDLAANNGGWQWSASTGVDAVPYFRIFNPTRQSQRFDPNGDFIRRYLPELAALDSKSIHQPSAQQAKKAGYALPIVDHATAVAQTKLWFKQLSEPTVDLFSEGELHIA